MRYCVFEKKLEGSVFDMFVLMLTQITLGRATKDKQIDVDLSLEGPAWKISRKQGDYQIVT